MGSCCEITKEVPWRRSSRKEKMLNYHHLALINAILYIVIASELWFWSELQLSRVPSTCQYGHPNSDYFCLIYSYTPFHVFTSDRLACTFHMVPAFYHILITEGLYSLWWCAPSSWSMLMCYSFHNYCGIFDGNFKE